MNALVKTIPLVLLATAGAASAQTKDPVNYVDTRIGTISHMLVPTFPSIQRPNGMLRIVPPNESFTTDRINGFGLSVPSHRQGSVFRLMPASGDAAALRPDWSSRYDHSTALPYRYSVFLDDHDATVAFAPGRRAVMCAVDDRGAPITHTRAAAASPAGRSQSRQGALAERALEMMTRCCKPHAHTEECLMFNARSGCAFFLGVVAFALVLTLRCAGQQPAAPPAPGPRLNRVIELFEQGKPALGTFVQNFSVRTAMSVARSGLDYILIDMEHAPYDVSQLQVFLMAMTDKQAIMLKGNLQPDVVPMVRIPQYGREELGFIVKQVLDVGVFGIMFPHIDTAEQARTAVSVSRYPQKKGSPDAEPIGHRGNAPTNAVWYWGVRNYAELADMWPLDKQGELLLAMQIETPEAVNNIDSILAVPGIGAVFIGPNDLSYNLGNFGNADTPEEEAALDKVLQACRKKGVPVGLTAYNPELVTRRLKQGFNFIAIGQEIGITAPVDATLRAARAFKQGS